MKKWKLYINLFLLILLLLGAAFIIATPADNGISRRVPWISAVILGLIGTLYKALSSDDEQRQEKALYEKYHPMFFRAIVIGIAVLIVVLRVCNVNHGYTHITAMYDLPWNCCAIP